VTDDPTQHKIDLKLASGAQLTLLYFSDRELRWIFAYDYIGEKDPGTAPEVVNKVRLVADYDAGFLTSTLVLSMNVIIPARLGQQFFAGMDISPGAKTYLEFTYERRVGELLREEGANHDRSGDEFRLIEICKGARDRVRLTGLEPAIVRPIEFPFPIPDRISVDFGTLRVPFRTNQGNVAHFDLPTRTLR
jgi:hypothetical protein